MEPISISMSIVSIASIVIFLWVFRKPIKTITETMPESIEIGSNIVTTAIREFETIAVVNCAESHSSSLRRLHKCAMSIKDEKIIPVDDALNIIYAKGKSVK